MTHPAVRLETADVELGSGSLHVEDVPRGAFALAGTAVALLLVGWLLVYFLVFLQRGPVN